ncbi:MAG: DUF805 domain-containing protein [Acidimicrobiia bacterium]
MESIDWQHLLFRFDGRINRAKFWIGVVVLWVVELVVLLILRSAGIGFALLSFLILVVIIWPALAIQVKRWHDRGKSGWFVLVALIPFVGWLWVLIECGFLEGDPGENQYGPNPLAA